MKLKFNLFLFILLFAIFSCEKEIIPTLQPIPEKPENLSTIKALFDYEEKLESYASYLYKYLVSVQEKVDKLNHEKYHLYPTYERFNRDLINYDRQNISDWLINIDILEKYIAETYQIAQQVYNMYTNLK